MKKPTKARAKSRADAAMSIYIRTKYAKRYGSEGLFVKCITCGRVNPISAMHNAHFISRGKEATRFLEENCHPACPGCNTYHQELHMRKYTLFMIDTYGREFVDWLEKESQKVCRRRVQDYLDIEAEYKAKLEALND